MAYDNARPQPDAHKAPYASTYDYKKAPSTYDYDPQYRAAARGRPDVPSNAAPGGLPHASHQPLKNAIGNAFEKSDAARVVDPALIAQITEQVKKSVLDEIKMGVVASAATQAQPVQVTPQQVPPSPASTTTSVPPRDVYTPPSPKNADSSSQASSSPDPLARDPLLDETDTPTPKNTQSDPIDTPAASSTTRPGPPLRMATEDCTPIERKWQRLFDPDNQPLPRLGQFLRGLALHLVRYALLEILIFSNDLQVEDYEPKGSLVISPSKMLKFYEEANIQEEIYPWQSKSEHFAVMWTMLNCVAIFGKLSYSSLSKIYRDMRCQHHLIQEHPADQPYIPALTPHGFQDWMTAMIQAYPDAEYERLAKAVLAMPISNADDRKERFPKELPRRLFPRAENLQAQQRCAANLSAEGVGPLRKAPTFPPPPPKAQPTTTTSNLERERSPYGSQPEPRVIDSEEELEPSSVPIERQRKPYAATPGGGKQYDDHLKRSVTADPSIHEQRKRTQSNAAQGPFPPPNDTYYDQTGHTRSGAQGTHRRARSPTYSNPGSQSDPNVRDIPSSYYASNLHSYDEDPRRYSKETDPKKHDRNRRSTADNTYDQPRSIYEDEEYKARHGSSGYESRGYDTRRY